MGVFTINSGTAIFYASQSKSEGTGNGIEYCYDIKAQKGDSVVVTLSGSFTGAYYVKDSGAEVSFTTSVTVTYNNSLKVCFNIPHAPSGAAFNTATINVNNSSTGAAYNTFNETVKNSNTSSISAESIGKFTQTGVNLIAATNFIVNSGLTEVLDVSLYTNTGVDISNSVTSTISGGDVTLVANNAVNNITIKIIGIK